jgi:ribosomal protein S18 acetylase RimI-like enzyme
MTEKILNQFICLKEYIYEKEHAEINALSELCTFNDKVDLKLELDYRLNMPRKSEVGLKNVNEFLYYMDDVLVAYIGISSFDGKTGEINGMTHPNWRRNGVFKRLFELAVKECKSRKFEKVLLLSDSKSISGTEFIKSVQGSYDFSEYRMKLTKETSFKKEAIITLRKSEKSDVHEITRQDAIFFGDGESEELLELEADQAENLDTYMIELDEMVIGKIKVEYLDNNSAYICGFGILPEYRGKGYGRAALNETLKLINEKNICDIELDVACKNDRALNLYKSCGFDEKAVMNYYEYRIG